MMGEVVEGRLNILHLELVEQGGLEEAEVLIKDILEGLELRGKEIMEELVQMVAMALEVVEAKELWVLMLLVTMAVMEELVHLVT
jgi:hypothetical protein